MAQVGCFENINQFNSTKEMLCHLCANDETRSRVRIVVAKLS